MQETKQQTKQPKQDTRNETTLYEQGISERVVSITKRQYERLTQKPFRVSVESTPTQVQTFVKGVGLKIANLSYNGQKLNLTLYNTEVLETMTTITKVDFLGVIQRHSKDYGFLAVVNSDIRDNLRKLDITTLGRFFVG